MAAKCQLQDLVVGAVQATVFLTTNLLMMVIEDPRNPEHDIYERFFWKEVAGWSLGIKELVAFHPFYRVNITSDINMADSVRILTESKTKRDKRVVYHVHSITGISKPLFMAFVSTVDSLFRFHHQLPDNGNKCIAPPQKEASESDFLLEPSAPCPKTTRARTRSRSVNPENNAIDTSLMDQMMAAMRQNPLIMSQMVMKMMNDSPVFKNSLLTMIQSQATMSMGMNAMMMGMNPMMMNAMMMNQMGMMQQQQLPSPAIAVPPTVMQQIPMATQQSRSASANPAAQPSSNEGCGSSLDTLNRTTTLNVTQKNENV